MGLGTTGGISLSRPVRSGLKEALVWHEIIIQVG